MIRDRRGNGAAGIFLLLGGMAVVISATQPWLKVSGPAVGLGDNALNIGGTPSFGIPVGDEIRIVVAACGFAIIVLAVCLIPTTMPGLGIVWRSFAFIVALVPAFAAAAIWAIIGDFDWFQTREQTVGDRIGEVVRGGLENLGLVRIEPTPGLLLMTGGLVAILIGVLLPARRTQEWVGHLNGATSRT